MLNYLLTCPWKVCLSYLHVLSIVKSVGVTLMMLTWFMFLLSELKLTTSNGYWSLRSIEIKTENIKKHSRTFSEVKVSFSIGRKPLFFVLFSIVPCMIIGMLVLVSFFIPVESGERIGLCATILLAVSVYLLVVTDQLPEQSDTLPLIGVYYIMIMFEIGLALAASVLVLRTHHATSEPPRILTYITGETNKILYQMRTGLWTNVHLGDNSSENVNGSLKHEGYSTIVIAMT